MRRPGPRGPLVLAGNAVLGVFFTAVSVGLVSQGLRDDDTALWVGGLLLVSPIALVIWVALLGNLLQYRFPRGLPAPRSGSWEGERGVEVPEWSYGRRVTPAIVVVGTVSGLLLGLGALVGGQPLFGGVGLAAGGAGVWLLVQMARGRIGFAGGVWLTPTRLVHRYGHQVTSVAWDDVREASAGGGMLQRADDEVVVRAEPGTVSHTGVEAGAPGGPGGPEKSFLVLDTRWLGVPADRLADTIQDYARDAGARAGLGGEQGRRRLLDAAHPVVRARAGVHDVGGTG